jgi:hypothetical protein
MTDARQDSHAERSARGRLGARLDSAAAERGRSERSPKLGMRRQARAYSRAPTDSSSGVARSNAERRSGSGTRVDRSAGYSFDGLVCRSRQDVPFAFFPRDPGHRGRRDSGPGRLFTMTGRSPLVGGQRVRCKRARTSRDRAGAAVGEKPRILSVEGVLEGISRRL